MLSLTDRRIISELSRELKKYNKLMEEKKISSDAIFEYEAMKLTGLSSETLRRKNEVRLANRNGKRMYSKERLMEHNMIISYTLNDVQ